MDEDEIKESSNCDMEASSDEEMELDEGEKVAPKPYVPGITGELKEDEELVMDESTYRLYLELQVEYPSLSFDILNDNLGIRDCDMGGDPQTAYIIAGTQATASAKNALYLMKMENMRPRRKSDEESGDDSADDSSSTTSDLDQQPEIESLSIKHKGTVNRVRAQQAAGKYLAATWSDSGSVFIYELSRGIQALNDSAVMSQFAKQKESCTSIFHFDGHRDEGFAMDWNKHDSCQGFLATGDCTGSIRVWTPRESNWSVSGALNGHTESVEDLQWSPSEPTVFISCSVDRSLAVWDTRSKTKKPMLSVADAHSADVNVCSWNRNQTHTLVSGGDDGALKIWDLRLFQQTQKVPGLQQYTHMFDYHKKPVTSVEWHPKDAGVFAASSEDDQVTLWDISLEQDGEEGGHESKEEALASIPVQLLFVHCGQKDVKEVHWHQQIPGLILSTALSGFNIFRTINI